MKKLIALFLALVMVLGMVACGTKEESAAPTETEAAAPAETEAAAPAETEAADAEPVDLTMWFQASTDLPEFMQNLPELVKSYYPHINLEVELLPSQAAGEKISVAYATNSCPDILFDGYSRISPAVSGGLAVDLTDVYEANKDIFYGEPVEGRVDGKQLYMPIHTGAAYCFIYNKTLAEELGVADMIPAVDETWSYEDFLAFARAVKAANPNIYPTALYAGNQSGDAWDYGMFLGNDATILNADHTASTVAESGNSEKIVEVLEFYQTLASEKLIPDGAAALTDADALALFYSGQLLMMPHAFNGVPGTYTQQEQGNAVEFEVSAVCQPTVGGTALAKTASWGSTGCAVFDSNGKAEAAKLVIDVMLKEQAWRQDCVSTLGSLPYHNDIAAEYATPELTAIMQFAISYGAAYADSTFGITEPFWSDCRGVFYPLKQDLFTGNITAEQFVEKWAEGLDAIITNYQAG